MFGIRNFVCRPYLPKSNLIVSTINSHVTVPLQTLSDHSDISHVKNIQTTAKNYTGKSSSQTPNIGEYDTLTEYHAYDMIHKLSENDRASLLKALNKYNSDKIKSKFQGNFLVCLLCLSKLCRISKNTIFHFI